MGGPVEAFSGPSSLIRSSSASEGWSFLLGDVNVVEVAVHSAKSATGGAGAVLGLLHENMFPDTPVPRGLGPLATPFGTDGSFLEGFICESVVSSIATSFVVLLGCDVPIDDDMVESVPDYIDEQSLRATTLVCSL